MNFVLETLGRIADTIEQKPPAQWDRWVGDVNEYMAELGVNARLRVDPGQININPGPFRAYDYKTSNEVFRLYLENFAPKTLNKRWRHYLS